MDHEGARFVHLVGIHVDDADADAAAAELVRQHEPGRTRAYHEDLGVAFSSGMGGSSHSPLTSWGLGGVPCAPMTASRTVLIVTLFVHEGREAEFDEFERQAARIMARHGGRVERVIRPTAVLPAGPLPREIHVVTFPDLAAFDAYRADAELVALAPLRAAAIARTDVTIGHDVT